MFESFQKSLQKELKAGCILSLRFDFIYLVTKYKWYDIVISTWQQSVCYRYLDVVMSTLQKLLKFYNLSKITIFNFFFTFLLFRSHANALERELAQSSQFTRNDRKLLVDGNFKNKGNSSLTDERTLATFATCVGSVFMYGLFKLTAPFLILSI